MAAIVFFGTPPLAVRYETWDEWRQDMARPVEPAPLIAPGTTSCAGCWGQGRILTPARNGEGLVPVPCPGCGGSGLVRVAPEVD